MEAAKKLQLYFISLQHEDQPTKEEMLRKEISIMEDELKTKSELIKKHENRIEAWREELKEQLDRHTTELQRFAHRRCIQRWCDEKGKKRLRDFFRLIFILRAVGVLLPFCLLMHLITVIQNAQKLQFNANEVLQIQEVENDLEQQLEKLRRCSKKITPETTNKDVKNDNHYKGLREHYEENRKNARFFTAGYVRLNRSVSIIRTAFLAVLPQAAR
ncbi:hypothetical protein KFK09_011074 [Dendrobium nobile]|uniref:Uncharacterized protein n=1 Tax=Dendrobium nobile TaxID=94219 RepID=A0A8T3BBP4_DENNO|nr:hypothetical protein KFK09_011074 [Dendrobium nobile]